jgi:hypothetical protein
MEGINHEWDLMINQAKTQGDHERKLAHRSQQHRDYCEGLMVLSYVGFIGSVVYAKKLSIPILSTLGLGASITGSRHLSEKYHHHQRKASDWQSFHSRLKEHRTKDASNLKFFRDERNNLIKE